MNKISLFKLLFFVGVLLLGDRLGGYALSKMVARSGQRFPMIYEGGLESEIAILGNSRGIHMFHPPAIEEVTGARVANLAFNDLSPEVMTILWEDYLENHSPPKLLILEVSCIGVVDHPGSIERFSFLLNRNPKFGSVIADANQTHYYVSQLSHLFRFNSPLTWRSLLFLKKNDQSWIMNSQLNPEMMAGTIANADAELRRNEKRLDAIRAISESAESRGTSVRLVVAPYAPDYFTRLDDYPDWLRWVETSLGRPVEDLTMEVSELQYFADHLHLNEAGAAFFAKKLGNADFFVAAAGQAASGIE